MTLSELKAIYQSVYYLEEDMILDVVLATCLATKLNCDPIWVLIIGGPSSGKSELVNTLNKIPFVHPVSSMTENTFLSNMRTSDGKEASMLHRIGTSGMMTMKDYTSILSMRSEKREVIVGQMREIYDGKLVKEAGNGNPQTWEGKLNWIGAVTESVYLAEDESAGMGRRTINYIMPEQDRIKTTQQSRKNNSDIGKKRTMIQDAFVEYVEMMLSKMEKSLPDIEDTFADELVHLADFVTLTRTPTSRNFRGELVLVPAPEMPMRVFHMFQTLAKVFMYMNEGTLKEEHKDILYRLALDSIPKQRMLTLKVLSKYQKVTTKGAAQELRYPTETMRIWLENVNVLGICEREAAGVATPDMWTIKNEYRQMMLKYGDIVPEEDILADKNEYIINDEINPTWAVTSSPIASSRTGSDDPGIIQERKEGVQRAFDAF